MKNYLLLVFFFIAILFSGFTASAQSWLWGQEGSANLKADVFEGSVATNRTGNVYQTGGFETSISFGTTTLTSLAGEDAFLVKYGPNGNLLWAKQSIGDSNSDALGYSVATDDSDNSYITGYAENLAGYLTDTLSIGSETLYLSGEEFFIAKFDPNGKLLWVKQPDTTIIATGTEAWAVATDKFGHEYVTGDGAFLIKYDRNGNVMWTVPQTNDTLGYTIGYSVATDISGNIYLSGTFTGSVQFGTYQLYSANGDIFTAKFDSNGHALWAQQSSNNNYFLNYRGVPSVAADKSGAAYVTASFTDTIMFGSHTFTSTDTTYSFFAVKYNPNGSIAWGKQAKTVNGSSWGSNSVCNDDLNHVYISGVEVGQYPASFIFANDTVNNARTTADFPSFLLKLDTSGNVICNSILYGGGILNSVASDSTGKFVYLGGVFESSFSIGPDSLTDYTGGLDTYVGRWQPCSSCALVVNITPQSPLFCAGQGVTLYANGGKNYTWSPATGLSATKGRSVVANPAITTTYTLAETDSLGCFGIAEDVVTVKPSPVANFNFTLNGNQATFNSAGSSSDVTSYSWNFGDNTISSLANPVHNFSAKDTFYVCLTVYNGSNCSYTLCKDVDLLSEGVNSITSQNSIQLYPNPADNNINLSTDGMEGNYQLKIYNIMGQQVWATAVKGIHESSLQTMSIPLTNLPSGTYQLILTNGKDYYSKPFVHSK